ncbi:hypothetical protein Sdia_42150 [Streptomyces diastaticus subsp. diastaticus]|uniref:Uncharacterized protein n=1 Tax=Streptomyces diastaticus subsp. diastaticus TaxID=68040 RepID=A0ABQ1CSW4_STRDI|nr:hypothetical protein Sdia_42150 [Streptomyces diastaticus subsp. diastaticus]GGU09580.1 hypothetical protein GCM10015534_09820 [Streptomyces diastaticus subsp. diastaticus]
MSYARTIADHSRGRRPGRGRRVREALGAPGPDEPRGQAATPEARAVLDRAPHAGDQDRGGRSTDEGDSAR